MAAKQSNAMNQSGAAGMVTWDGTSVESTYAATQYYVQAGSTSGLIQNLASLGTSGQVLTSNGGGALPTWQTAAGGGVQTFTYISTQTASSVANLDFTSLDNTYKAYRFCLNTLTAGSGSIQIKASTDNLSTFATLDATYVKFIGGATQVLANLTTSAVTITLTTGGTSATHSGYVDIANIGEATKQIMLTWNTSSTATAANSVSTNGTGQDDTREAINSIRFAVNSAATGTIILYGIS